MAKDDSEKIKKKLNELDAKLDKLTDKTFAYLLAIIQILQDKGLVTPKEMKTHLDHYKKGIGKVSQDIEFWKLMRQIKGKRK